MRKIVFRESIILYILRNAGNSYWVTDNPDDPLAKIWKVHKIDCTPFEEEEE
jgi:hypothetical protein